MKSPFIFLCLYVYNAVLNLIPTFFQLVVNIREAIDRKQENMRRRRRRDALRLQLVRVFEIIAKQGTLSRASSVVDQDTGGLSHTFTDYIDGARLYLESESDKELVPSVREIKTHFSSFIKNLIGSFSRKFSHSLLVTFPIYVFCSSTVYTGSNI